MNKNWTFFHSIGLIFIVIGMTLIGIYFPVTLKLNLMISWTCIFILLALFVLIAGQGITGRLWGFLIDQRNKISLSQFQTALWTILILSAFLSAALFNMASYDSFKKLPIKVKSLDEIKDQNIRSLYVPLPKSSKEDGSTEKYYTLDFDRKSSAIQKEVKVLMTDSSNDELKNLEEYKNPLDIRIPELLWALMGISVVSLVGSPLLKNNKSKDTSLSLKTPPDGVAAAGSIVVNPQNVTPAFSDIFKGEEISNYDKLDLCKVQMFFFTIILFIAYFIMLANMFYHSGFVFEFPDLNPSMIALIGISHAGYLTSKAIPR
jgi:hypothetical protein